MRPFPINIPTLISYIISKQKEQQDQTFKSKKEEYRHNTGMNTLNYSKQKHLQKVLKLTTLSST